MLICILSGCRGVVVCSMRLPARCYVFKEVVGMLLCVLRVFRGVALVAKVFIILTMVLLCFLGVFLWCCHVVALCSEWLPWHCYVF